MFTHIFKPRPFIQVLMLEALFSGAQGFCLCRILGGYVLWRFAMIHAKAWKFTRQVLEGCRIAFESPSAWNNLNMQNYTTQKQHVWSRTVGQQIDNALPDFVRQLLITDRTLFKWQTPAPRLPKFASRVWIATRQRWLIQHSTLTAPSGLKLKTLWPSGEQHDPFWEEWRTSSAICGLGVGKDLYCSLEVQTKFLSFADIGGWYKRGPWVWPTWTLLNWFNCPTFIPKQSQPTSEITGGETVVASTPLQGLMT